MEYELGSESLPNVVYCIVLQKRKVRCVRKTREQLTTLLPLSISIGLSIAIGS